MDPAQHKDSPFWRNAKLRSKGGKWFDSFEKYKHAKEGGFLKIKIDKEGIHSLQNNLLYFFQNIRAFS